MASINTEKSSTQRLAQHIADVSQIDPSIATVAPAIAAQQDVLEITDKQRLVQGLRTESAADLVKTLETIKKSNPKAYDDAIRDFVKAGLADKSALEGHLLIFDTDGDQSLSTWEMFFGPLAVNLSTKTSAILALGASIVMGLKTATWYKPWTWFAVNIDPETIQAARHPDSDSKLFADKQSPAARAALLDKLWKYSEDGTLSLKQMEGYFTDIANANAGTLDKIQSRGEFSAIFEVTGTETVTRQQLEDFYDNVMFYQVMDPKDVAERLIALRPAASAFNSADTSPTAALAGSNSDVGVKRS